MSPSMRRATGSVRSVVSGWKGILISAGNVYRHAIERLKDVSVGIIGAPSGGTCADFGSCLVNAGEVRRAESSP
jgi:hypothetical protein